MGARFDDTPVARPTVNAHVEEAADEQAEQERDEGFDHRVTRPSMTRMDAISPTRRVKRACERRSLPEIGRFSPPLRNPRYHECKCAHFRPAGLLFSARLVSLSPRAAPLPQPITGCLRLGIPRARPPDHLARPQAGAGAH